MSEVVFSHRIRVRYHETDAQTFLFNSRYLEYADVAMTEFFRSLGWTYPQMLAEGFDPSVVKTSLEFRSPARLDDLVEVQVRCSRVGTSSLTLGFVFFVDDLNICEVESVYVNVDSSIAASRSIPEAIASKLRAATLNPRDLPTLGVRT
ncbi:acyl-CoA thioesterase [Paenarthrobacter sp. NPDC089989]|uniref:acyl-CoA thioesterase n=1 Tax=unclassified Paenarthrobacter TaxID=2634190 RepID=UPI00381E2017